jgi:predicted  nucleic acid-binding Zn-ribbon protein
MDSPVELINKVAIDPLMEKVFEKHDTSQDSNIILNINNRIRQLQNEMQEMVNQKKYLQTEISKINQKLG